MRLTLAAIALVIASPVVADETITREQAAQFAFLAEIAPHTCGSFEQNIPSVAAWMANNDIAQEDLMRRDRLGVETVKALSQFQGNITWSGVKATCDGLYKMLGPSGADLVKR